MLFFYSKVLGGIIYDVRFSAFNFSSRYKYFYSNFFPQWRQNMILYGAYSVVEKQ